MHGIAVARSAWLLALALSCSCRSREAPPPSAVAATGEAKSAAGAAVSPAAAPVAPAADLALGVAELVGLRWRERGGQEAFERARAAERRGDWAEMVKRCQDALLVDPSHLEASWLLAAGLSHLGRFSEVAAPLLVAVAGDPMKWALPALQLPFFARFWASGQGDGLRPWISALPPRLGAMLPRSVILLQRGRLLAFDPEERRLVPLTSRIGIAGALLEEAGGSGGAAKAVPRRLAFVGKKRLAGGKKAELMLGVIDLQTGGLVEVALPEANRTELVFTAGVSPKLLVRVDAGGAASGKPASGWQELVVDQLAPASAPTVKAVAARLEITGGRAERTRPPIAGVIADWDQAGMASALRLRRSNRLVAPPAPALIDGQRVSWSPSQGALALVASLEDCERELAPGKGNKPTAPPRRSVAFVVDPITGAAREVAHSTGVLELAWISDSLLAVASDRGVELFELSTAAATSVVRLEGDLSLGVPLRASRCAAEPARPGDPGDSPDAEAVSEDEEPALGGGLDSL